MKIVLDTNILISGFIFGGRPNELIANVIEDKDIKPVTSKYLVDELARVFDQKFYQHDRVIKRALKLVKKRFAIITPDFIPGIITDDDSDNQVLAVAIYVKANYIVSGDKHLLNLKSYQNIPIVTASEFLDFPLK